MGYVIWPDGPSGDVVQEVWEERQRQDEKWGQQNLTPEHHLAILAEEFGEAGKAVVKLYEEPEKFNVWLSNLRLELVQTAAVAVQMIESLDRNYKL